MAWYWFKGAVWEVTFWYGGIGYSRVEVCEVR